MVEQSDIIGLPTTLKRVAKTTVIVEDGNTVVIGGLIQETRNDTSYKVPCLGNTPGLGWLFKSESKSDERKNLYIFLTPRIVENKEDARRVYEMKRDHINSVKEGAVKLERGQIPERLFRSLLNSNY